MRPNAGSALLVLLAIAAGSCGLLTPDEGAGRGFDDPVSGFSEAAAVEVCLGSRRVVSAAQAGGGALALCVGAGAAARACTGDGACGPGERCTCGRCTTRPCRNATDCDGMEVCQSNRCARSCAKDGDCAAGEVCRSGGCARPCASDASCPFGESCSTFDGTCVVKLCGGAVTCGQGEECVEQEMVAALREPHVVRAAGGVVGYVELRTAPDACGVYRARVQDRRRWVIEPAQPVLEAGPEDGGCLGAPSVWVQDGSWTMLAARGDGGGVVAARSSDGVTFARESGIVLAPSEP